jgi:hypothetical protein
MYVCIYVRLYVCICVLKKPKKTHPYYDVYCTHLIANGRLMTVGVCK